MWRLRVKGAYVAGASLAVRTRKASGRSVSHIPPTAPRWSTQGVHLRLPGVERLTADPLCRYDPFLRHFAPLAARWRGGPIVDAVLGPRAARPRGHEIREICPEHHRVLARAAPPPRHDAPSRPQGPV